MNAILRPAVAPDVGGIQFHGGTPAQLRNATERLHWRLKALGLDSPRERGALVKTHDTLSLCQTLGLDTRNKPEDLEREILLAMISGPTPFVLPSYEELESALRIRMNIVYAARRTALAFDTEQAERPVQYWDYSERTGFIIRPGVSLIEALQKTTQPERSGRLYSFSCYRATEYVILLAVAQELADSNLELAGRLERQWRHRAIMSGEFHDAFLHEYGTLAEPLPAGYYVPGDRLWFRNPDEHSSNVEGYEGSWVFYLGGGLFTNFWKRDEPFTLETKCVELFHWRNATWRDARGVLRVNDELVDERVRQSLENPREVREILATMQRLREPAGVYRDGGCIDATREYVRCVRPGSATITLAAEPL